MEAIAKGIAKGDSNANPNERARVIKRIADFIKKEEKGRGHRR